MMLYAVSVAQNQTLPEVRRFLGQGPVVMTPSSTFASIVFRLCYGLYEIRLQTLSLALEKFTLTLCGNPCLACTQTTVKLCGSPIKDGAIGYSNRQVSQTCSLVSL